MWGACLASDDRFPARRYRQESSHYSRQDGPLMGTMADVAGPE